MQKIAFYTRISTDEDHQKYSLEAQKDRLEAFCTSQFGDEWQLHKIYRDTESGTHMNRPGLEEMLYDASRKAFDTLLVFRVDRLSRKVRELAQMVDELIKCGVTLKSITEPFDTASSAGRMMLQMLGVFAEFEHATIVERTKVGMEKKAKGGAFVGGVVPFGYQLDPDKGLVVNEDEAILVRKMFQMYAIGQEGASAISKKLNGNGHRNRNGKKWQKRVVLHMLKNPVYIGKLRWRGVVYDGQHDAIVSDTLYETAMAVLAKRNAESKGRQLHNGDERLLTGIIKCAKCNSRMFGGGGNTNGTYVPYYVCSKRHNGKGCKLPYIRADIIEKAIVKDVKAILQDEQLMARIWEEANRQLGAEKPDIDKEIGRVETQMTKTRSKIERYFDAFEDGTMKPEVCGKKLDELNGCLEELELERERLEARRQRLSLPEVDREMLQKLMGMFEEVFASGNKAQKKHLLQSLVKKVLIHNRETVEIWYTLPNSQQFEYWNKWLPGRDALRNVSKQCAFLRLSCTGLYVCIFLATAAPPHLADSGSG